MGRPQSKAGGRLPLQGPAPFAFPATRSTLPANRSPESRVPAQPATPAKVRPARAPRVVLHADGWITNRRFERLAIMIADGFSFPDAWKVLPSGVGDGTLKSANKGGSLEYRRKVEQNGLFKARVATLKAEREELMQDKAWGEIEHQIRTVYRHAHAVGDVKMMMTATESAIKVATIKANAMPKPDSDDPPETEGKKRAPGRPTAESTQSKRNPAEIRDKLINMGVKEPENDEENDE